MDDEPGVDEERVDVSSETVESIDEAVEAENFKKVEAALFISGRFLNIQELVSLTDVNPILLRKILKDLEYKHKDSGIEIVERNGLWKMDVTSEHKDVVKI